MRVSSTPVEVDVDGNVARRDGPRRGLFLTPIASNNKSRDDESKASETITQRQPGAIT